MQPDFFCDELMLRAARIVMKTLGMARMFALHFLQKHDVGIQLAQAIAQLVQHHTAVEMGKTFVNVVGSDFQRLHGGYSTQSALWRVLRATVLKAAQYPLRTKYWAANKCHIIFMTIDSGYVFEESAPQVWGKTNP